MMPVIFEIERLVRFALARGLLAAADIPFARNALLRALSMAAPDGEIPEDPGPLPPTATPMLEALETAAVAAGLVEDMDFDREQFGAHLMNLLTPRPSEIARDFAALWAEKDVRAATDWLYALCQASDYIRVDQIARNTAFASPSPYGELEITINLSKPEKDPREIARAKTAPTTGYPRCMLCVENEGYAGRPGYPSHETLRMVPIRLGGEAWYLQYSPYSYYPEHCIALNERHTDMSVSRRAFALLLDFVGQFPHYFIGSNADLPIVGGSILSHDHFQGGRHVFPMDKAPAYAAFRREGQDGVRVEAVEWPMTCLRLTSGDKDALVSLADEMLTAWRAWDDPDHQILHETTAPHNTITPIARQWGESEYMLQLVLRNNRTTAEHPLGIFHPHADLHHIKKENIGLIEVMGLFILPGRLESELAELSALLTQPEGMQKPAEDHPLAKHYDWYLELRGQQSGLLSEAEATQAVRRSLGEKCARVLEDCGVYKLTPKGRAGLAAFLAGLGFNPA